MIALALAACLPALGVAADAYPTKTVRVVAPFAPGGGTDTVARVVAQQFSEQLGKTFIVDNRTGASGIIAFEIVAKSAPDGHTLLLTNSAFASLPGLFNSLPYDTVKSFTPVSEILRAPNVLVVHPSVSEAGVAGMAIYSWAGLLAPAGLSKTLITKLHGEVVKMLAVPAVRERFAAQDAELVGSRPEAFSKMLGGEISRWAGLIRVAGIAQQ